MKQYGFEMTVYVKGQPEPIDHDFFLSEEEAERARGRAYKELDDVENVIIDEVIYDDETGETEAA